MNKKLAGMGLCLVLATSLCLAENNPFDDTTISVSTSTSADEEATATTSATVDTTEDTATNTSTETATSTEKEKEEASTKTVEYTVVDGDYLMKIAAKFYNGDSSKWPLLVEANKDRYPSLLSNPNLIYAGWVLTIPDADSAAAVTVASNNTSSSSSSSTSVGSTTANPPSASASADDKTRVASGKAPKRAVNDATGAPALKTQSAPTGSCINTKSPQFQSWFNGAIDTYGDWEMPVINNKYGQTISVEMFMKAILHIESNGTHRKADGSLVTSCCGAQGFCQLMPATAQGLGVDGTDPKQNLEGSVKLFKQIFTSTYVGKKTGVDKMILAACGYNAGPWSKRVQGTWEDCKAMGSGEVASYGIKFKMCVGLELTSDERQYVQNHFLYGGYTVDSYCDLLYSSAQGLCL